MGPSTSSVSRHLQSAGVSKGLPEGHRGTMNAVDALNTADAEISQNARATPRVSTQRSAGASDPDDSAHQGEWERHSGWRPVLAAMRMVPYAASSHAVRIEGAHTPGEWWSMTAATHQQNGQHWGNANGNQGAQKPADVGTAVRSTCQTWLGCLAVTTRVLGGSSAGLDCGSSFKIRPTVVTPRCNPARHSVSAILTFQTPSPQSPTNSAIPT